MHKHDSIKDRIQKGTMVLLAVIIAALAAGNIWLDSRKTWDEEYPFANRHITWEYKREAMGEE